MSKLATFSVVWCLKGTSAEKEKEISLYKSPTNKFTETLKEIICNKINAQSVCPPNVFLFFKEFNKGAKHEKEKEFTQPHPLPKRSITFPLFILLLLLLLLSLRLSLSL